MPKPSRSLFFLPLAAGILALFPALSHGQSDNFSSGNDAAWTRYTPLDYAGAGGTFSFPDGGYRIQSAEPPSIPTQGPGRTGSLRGDVTYSDFSESVDVLRWADSFDQSFGLLARVRQPGQGTSDGYFFLYRPTNGDFLIHRVDNESGARIGRGILRLDSAASYRFVFSGRGSVLTGEVFDLAHLETPLLSFSATDSTYTAGLGGLLVTTNATNYSGTGDATFDNYRAAVPEPAGPALLLAGAVALAARRRPPALPFVRRLIWPRRLP